MSLSSICTSTLLVPIDVNVKFVTACLLREPTVMRVSTFLPLALKKFHFVMKRPFVNASGSAPSIQSISISFGWVDSCLSAATSPIWIASETALSAGTEYSSCPPDTSMLPPPTTSFSPLGATFSQKSVTGCGA